MGMLAAIYTIGLAIVCGLIVWSFTKSGKKWLKEL